MPLVKNIGPGEPGRVCVSGGPLVGDLLNTHAATAVGFFDRFGDLHVVVYRTFSDDMWGLVTKDDVDWRATLIRLGIEDTGPIHIAHPKEIEYVNKRIS